MSFHAPEAARRPHPFDAGGVCPNNGAFDVDSPAPGWRLAFICSDGEAWEHVSVHAYRARGRTTQTRTPSWEEMSFIKRLCWDVDDVVMQLHPREADYVNCHPHVLHLWRPQAASIPTPPADMV